MATARAVAAGRLLAASVRDVIANFEREGELLTIPGAEWDLEIGALTEMQALRNGPALLFNQINSFPDGYRVLTNMTNNPRRVAMLMGLGPRASGVETVQAIRQRIRGLKPVEPVEVSSAEFREVTQRGEHVDLFKFPTPLWHELDGGRFLGTACVVVTRDPEAGWVNLGTYRVQVHDAHTTGLYVQESHHASMILRRYWERNEAAPVAVCIGVQPAVLMGGFLAIPWGQSEYQWAGGFAGQPIEIVRGELTGLPLPASAEIVLEGFCPPPSQRVQREGPFGETIGYYASGARDEPIIDVQLVQHRRDPILVGSPPLRPPASSSASYLFRSANLWEEIERSGVSDVKGVWMMPSGASSLLAVVSVKQRYGGHAKQVGLAAMSGRAGGGQLGRFVIVVDDDIDPSDQDQVLWAIATRCDPETAIDVIRGMTSHDLDPLVPPDKRAVHDYSMSRAVINACRPYPWMKDFPTPVGCSPELERRMLDKWSHLFTNAR